MTLLAAENHVLNAKDSFVLDFSDREHSNIQWRITDDGVMGGLSKGYFEISPHGILEFGGKLSLDNNGGFSSVRSSDVNLDLSEQAGIALRVKGDGRTYQFRLNTDARYWSYEVSFSAEFQTQKNQWLDIRIPFENFRAGFRGRSLNDVKLDPSKVRRIGILLGDKKPGPFLLKIDSISSY